ncbi:uncharacterized protein HMPREF1541_10309 [Cyphellophora europaea CBS 101466]|uniref:HIG1 domain-containing protein n=1 Tax=Cyphellophora europaea (strain CBS 101466) TaxID=1220924 RepID=W2S9N9_CYPE1|nr:uncharacterized protein HMPREF1541_10309 [Cyphellophora europaea CBS 101466]ETN44639.1 hypothetical protein HMPREF1541_10309 [Cyphellophora europaea CBS 101466]
MKILTKEEEAAHYRETLKGGAIGGFSGLGLGLAGVAIASGRYHFFRTLTLPLKAFLVTSAGTFGGIVAADHWSRKFEQDRNPIDREYQESQKEKREEQVAGKTFTQRAIDFGREERYKIVGGSWILSMVAAFSIVNRNKYLTGAQKLVQARVYAQFLTLGVLVASAAFEISDQRQQTGRWETVKYIDPSDPEHKRIIEKEVEVKQGFGGEKEDRSGRDRWKEMVDAEEQRLKGRQDDEKRWKKDAEKRHHSANGKKNGKKEQHDEDKEKSDSKAEDKKGEKAQDKKD